MYGIQPTLQCYFRCAQLPPPLFCAAHFGALTQHRSIWSQNTLGVLIVCEFHTKISLEQKEENSDLPLHASGFRSS